MRVHWHGLQVLHYVEKPETFVSNIINAGGYLFSMKIFQHLAKIFTENYENELMWVTLSNHVRHGSLIHVSYMYV